MPLRARLTTALSAGLNGVRRVRAARHPVSVVVTATAAQARFLPECLESLRRQTYPGLEVLVVPVGTGVAAYRAAGSGRFRMLPAEPSVAAARDAGARAATGEFLAFATAADTVPPGGYAALAASLLGSGSRVAVADLRQTAPARHLTRSGHHQVHLRTRAGVDLVAMPEIARDPWVGNRLFVRSWWAEQGFTFDEDERLDEALMARVLAAAPAFDVLAEVGYVAGQRGDGLPFGTLVPVMPVLGPWLSRERATLAALAGPARQAHLLGLLDARLTRFLDDAERADEGQWSALAGFTGECLEAAEPRLLARVRAEPRVKAWLAAHAGREDLCAFVAARWFADGQQPTVLRDGRVLACLPFLDSALGVPDELYELTPEETALVLSRRRLVGTADGVRLDLYGYIDQVDLVEPPQVSGRLTTTGVECEISTGTDSAVTRFAGQRHHDYRYGALSVLLPGPPAADVALEVRMTVGAVTRIGTIRPIDVPQPARAAATVVTGLELAGGTLTVRGAGPARGLDLDRIRPELHRDGDSFTARFALREDPWGLGPRPLASGPRRLVAEGGLGVATELADRLPLELRDASHLLVVEQSEGALVVRVQAPRTDDERGPFAQTSLRAAYASRGTAERAIRPDLVYLQCYPGESATDSQLEIFAALRPRRPDLTVRWGVADASKRVPEGAEPVLIGSRDHYRVLATAGYVCANIELDRWFHRRPGQRYLQTFHGYPAKAMGVPLWEAKNFTPLRIEAQLDHTSRNWDVALTPTPEMDEVYRRCYRYDGEILSVGYPRNDPLVPDGTDRAGLTDGADGARRATRRRLGIDAARTAVLYAPTWRDDLATGFRAAALATGLDPAALAAALGPEYVLLLRGHRFHRPSAAALPNLVDVTTYPQVNDLVLASDAALLDYSSLRFDYALTGRPMVFHVPDLEEYAGAGRGFLFDFPFAETAPGPLLSTFEEVVSALRSLPEVGSAHAPAYQRFNARFNRLHDGHAAERVVAAFFG